MAAIALHKQHRELLFSGDVVRLDLNPGKLAWV